ncbi:type II toxin-antitoxin system HicB family antitoxin [Psychrobacter ciconiae]|uniref:type II toxin-antitoxin system HicB family antitoxin n=1 Tax=Psychrobacter ciconiae TaxID=1553449 RepID=UPI001919A59F|nr:type II toxin-antitoxin system HicB family antitoxin [Psychrobacter ciconiae]
MQNIMMINDHKAIIQYDPEIDLFRGEFVGLNGGADFYGDSISALEQEGKQSLQAFLDVCQEQGITPYKSFSGKFVTRLPSELHEQVSTIATSHGMSLNQWITNTLANAVKSESMA